MEVPLYHPSPWAFGDPPFLESSIVPPQFSDVFRWKEGADHGQQAHVARRGRGDDPAGRCTAEMAGKSLWAY